MLHFYYHPDSLYCARVRLFLEETQIPYRAHLVDLFGGEQYLPEFKNKNPFCKVPFIEIEHLRLGESAAIMKYLAARFERFDLYPYGLEERADVDQWIDFLSGTVAEPLSDLVWWRHFCPRLGRPVALAEIESAERRLCHALPHLDRQLTQRRYIAGSDFTLADMMILPFLALHQRAAVNLNPYPSIERWLLDVSGRPAWKAAAPK